MVNTYVKQQIKHLELENYSSTDLFRWVESVMKPYDIKTYKETIDISECLWDRIGRGHTLLSEVPLKEWLTMADT